MGICVSIGVHQKTVEGLNLQLEYAAESNNALENENTGCHAKIKKLEAHLDKEQTEHDVTSGQLRKLRDAHTSTLAEHAATTDAKEGARKEVERLSALYSEAEAKDKALTAAHDAQSQVLAGVQTENAEMHERTARLQQETDECNGARTRLTSELTQTKASFATYVQQATAKERHLLLLAASTQGQLADHDREDLFKPPGAKPEKGVERAAHNWKQLAKVCKDAKPVIDTGAADKSTAPTTAAERRRSSMEKATAPDLGPWKQPLLPKPPMKLVKGSKELANNRAPDGMFE